MECQTRNKMMAEGMATILENPTIAYAKAKQQSVASFSLDSNLMQSTGFGSSNQMAMSAFVSQGLGNTSMAGFGNMQPSMFGSIPATTPPPGIEFGSQSAFGHSAFGQTSMPTSSFGTISQGISGSSAFGNGFQRESMQSDNGMAQLGSTQPSNSFAVTASLSSFSAPSAFSNITHNTEQSFVNPSTLTTNQSTLRTTSLKPEEEHAFQLKRFEFGKIPEIPPPAEFINIAF